MKDLLPIPANDHNNVGDINCSYCLTEIDSDTDYKLQSRNSITKYLGA